MNQRHTRPPAPVQLAQSRSRPNRWRRTSKRKRGFLLIMVLLVISTLSLAALNFSDSMLIAHETSRLEGKRFQARMMVESGIQSVRLFVASPRALRTEMGGSWSNPQKFQALNVVPDMDPTFRGNVTMIAPSLDQAGVINGFRYGLQNESAKLNLNALVELDKLVKTAAVAGAAGGAGGQGGGPGGSGQGGGAGGQGGGPGGPGPSGGGGQGGGNNGGGGAGGSGGQGTNSRQTSAPGGNAQAGQNQTNQSPAGGGGGAGGTGGFGGGGGGGAGAGGGNFGGGFGGGGGGFGGGGGGGFGAQGGGLASLAGVAGQDLAAKMLLALPGMTPDVADAILDFIDADDEPRPYGAEYADYYQQMQPPYKPLNGPLTSVEQLLLVRGVTPQLLFGYDQNRNGYIDASEQNQMISGMPAGGMPGALPMPTSPSGATGSGSSAQATMPGPLGWAPYLTLHSMEKNVALDGTKRININSDDLQTLYEELQATLGNEEWASYIIAYRIGGQPPPGASSPLQALLTAAASTTSEDGMMGAQLSALTQNTGNNAANNTPGQGQQGQKQPWNAQALASLDLSQQQGSVKFTQILDLVDSSVTLPGQGGGGGGAPNNQGGQNGSAYSSPITGLPTALANVLPKLMDKLTTVDSESIPGRINIMECPREILAGIPGMTTEIVDAIIQARADGSETENRNYETWLAVEGLVTLDQMRGFMPLMTCGGDVFKAQVVGYYEGSAPFCRAEAIISGAGATPKLLFYRRLDHLGRGFDVTALGQRTDVGLTPTATRR